ncbi:M23 family metallopeptidase [Leptotrichia sp. oral taxon 212]|uniref:M23 family metallopeptidase n=1 Tax=Leptotrichia sp. oral taxon 212 TaxID=712357 RepID=UPI0006A9794C|nr:M23 family metallopeptidase [Leptotrichia sp. oral taxon 212]
MMNGSGIRITGKKLQYDIEKKAGILIIAILFFCILFQINQTVNINSGYLEEEITENIEEKLQNIINTEEKRLSETAVKETVKNEKINHIEKDRGIIKISEEEGESIKNTGIIRIRDNIADINTKKDMESISLSRTESFKGKVRENINEKDRADNQNIQIESIESKGFGKILWPVKYGKITSKFGNRNHPVLKSVKFHRGVDIAVSIGTPVYSGIKGRVTFAGRKGNYGNLVEIEGNNRIKVRYAHLNSIDVVTGQKVSDGEKVAETGNTGMSTGPHLHYEIIIDENPVNPLDFAHD